MEQPNGIAVRLAVIERQVDRLLDLEPAVVKQEVANIKEDLATIRDDISAIRKILIGFLVTFAFAGVSTVVAIFISVGTG